MDKSKELKITTNSQYQGILARIELFIEKGFGNLNGKETDELKHISLSVAAFEKDKHPVSAKKLSLPDGKKLAYKMIDKWVKGK